MLTAKMHPHHREHFAWLEALIQSEQHGLSDFVLSGFLRIVTHPSVFIPPSSRRKPWHLPKNSVINRTVHSSILVFGLRKSSASSAEPVYQGQSRHRRVSRRLDDRKRERMDLDGSRLPSVPRPACAPSVGIPVISIASENATANNLNT
jgi:hypothetical protein